MAGGNDGLHFGEQSFETDDASQMGNGPHGMRGETFFAQCHGRTAPSPLSVAFRFRTFPVKLGIRTKPPVIVRRHDAGSGGQAQFDDVQIP